MSFEYVAALRDTDASDVTSVLQDFKELDVDGFPKKLKEGKWKPPIKAHEEAVAKGWIVFMNKKSFSSENLSDTLTFLYLAFIKFKNLEGLNFFLRHVLHRVGLGASDQEMHLSSILALTIRFHSPVLLENSSVLERLKDLLKSICDYGGQPYLLPKKVKFSAISEALIKNTEEAGRRGGGWENVLLFLDDIFVPSDGVNQTAINTEKGLILYRKDVRAMHPSNLSYVKKFIEREIIKREKNVLYPNELMHHTIKYLHEDEKFSWDEITILDCEKKLMDFIPWFIETTRMDVNDVHEGHTLLTSVLEGEWFERYYEYGRFHKSGDELLGRPKRERVLKCVFDKLLSVKNIDVLKGKNGGETPAQIILENDSLLMRHKFILLMDLMNKNEKVATDTGNLKVVLENVLNLTQKLIPEENKVFLKIPDILNIVLSFENNRVKLKKFQVPGFPGHVMETPGPCALLEILKYLIKVKRIKDDTPIEVEDADKGIDYSSMGFRKRYINRREESPFESEFWLLDAKCTWNRVFQ